MPDLQLAPVPIRRPARRPDLTPPPYGAQPPPETFSVTRRTARDGTVSLILAGELDLAGRADLTRALEPVQRAERDVVLDVEALTMIDASCLAVVFAAAARARREDGLLFLLEPCAQVRRVLDLTGATDGVVVLYRSDAPFSDLFRELA